MGYSPPHKRMKALPSADSLRSLLRYEPETGKLFWRSRSDAPARWNGRYAGKEAFTCVAVNGYKVGSLHGKTYYAHRIAFKITTGADPVGDIDHINGDRADNRSENLRDVSRSENQRNKVFRKLAKSGVPGVHWRGDLKKWAAMIGVEGKTVNLGAFAEKAEAIATRRAAERKYGFTDRHGAA